MDQEWSRAVAKRALFSNLESEPFPKCELKTSSQSSMNTALSVTQASMVIQLAFKSKHMVGLHYISWDACLCVAKAKFIESYIIFWRSAVCTRNGQNFEHDRRDKPSSKGRNLCVSWHMVSAHVEFPQWYINYPYLSSSQWRSSLHEGE